MSITITNRSKKLSALLDRFVPQYIRDEYSTFTKFIQYYFEFLEKDGEVFALISDFLHIIDIDKILKDDPYSNGDTSILEHYISQYISQFPLYRLEDVDIHTLIKQSKNFYNCIGTENSFNFIFRMMNKFGSFSFYYPYKYLLKCSDPYDGKISSDKHIHDNLHYAYYTYEIRSTEFGYTELKDILENLLHIAGCKVFFLRYIQDECSDPYAGGSENNEYFVFALDDLPVQWEEFLTIDAVYKSGALTYDDLETGNAGLLDSFTYAELGDTFNNLENASGNLNIFPYQKNTELSLE